jgi:hypothetical protein
MNYCDDYDLDIAYPKIPWNVVVEIYSVVPDGNHEIISTLSGVQ